MLQLDPDTGEISASTYRIRIVFGGFQGLGFRGAYNSVMCIFEKFRFCVNWGRWAHLGVVGIMNKS